MERGLLAGSVKQALKSKGGRGHAARAVAVLCGLGGEVVPVVFAVGGEQGAILVGRFLLGMCECAGGDYSARKKPRSLGGEKYLGEEVKKDRVG